MENCVFCNLANGIWDSATLYEDTGNQFVDVVHDGLDSLLSAAEL